ncbi:MAG TPA: RNA-binding protein [Parafilimonas sp.]|nr:RNA-binding protein [Parafilimonas sp.]
MKLFIAGFPNDFDDADIKEMFELYGAVKSAGFVTDRATGKSKGFGFVDMPDNMEAMETIRVLHGTKIKGKQITVQKAEERPGNRSRSDFNKRY